MTGNTLAVNDATVNDAPVSRVVEDDAEGVALAGAQSADAVAHCHAK